VYWNNCLKSVIVLGTLLIVIRTFTIYRPHVVIAALVFAFTIVGIAIKLCFVAFKSVQHSEITHPYAVVSELCMSSLCVQDRDFASLCRPIENICQHMRKIFMADDYVESFKVCFLILCSTYLSHILRIPSMDFCHFIECFISVITIYQYFSYNCGIYCSDVLQPI
ncbi:hypothetical protein MXB_4667, partial [Myxobolus squamalis]